MKERVYYTVEVRDKEGKRLRHFTRKSHSFVRQWNQLVNVHAKATSLSITDVTNTAKTVTVGGSTLRMNGVAATTTYGIVVGRGSTAVTINDYALETRCEEGTSTNELNYQACTVANASVSGSDCSFTVTRSAINNSGATITVTEIGIQVYGYSAGDAYFLGIRDVLTTTIDVPNGGAITVEYTIKVTV